ncbi:hypothetical protein FI667_g5953, partial [Globisporangium splendens]
MTGFKLPLLLIWICATVLTPIQSAAAADVVPATAAPVAPSCGPRVRRAWTALAYNEQMLYKNAIALSMKSGAYIKFVEIHTEYESMTEAHKTCMLIYWHYLFLVAFENMLRAQGPAYACITVPYWDWINDYNRFVNHECTSMLNCSTALQGLGGIVDGKKVDLPINGVPTDGVCHTAYPLNFFCHAGNITDTSKCSGCITRGPWDTKFLPASASYASVRNQIFAASNIAEFSFAIENGAHNAIHAALDGAMGSFASSADPIFWSHHAMVDLLHTIFHKCLVGEQVMTLAQKATNPIGWTTCRRKDNTTFGALDRVTIRTALFGLNPLDATLDPVVGKYFNVLPTQFAALMDNNDLGSSSYLYQGLLGEMYTKCGNATTAAPLSPTPTATQVPVPAATPSPAVTTKAPLPTVTPTPTTRVPVPSPTPTTGAPIPTPPPTPPPAPTPTTRLPTPPPSLAPPTTPSPTRYVFTRLPTSVPKVARVKRECHLEDTTTPLDLLPPKLQIMVAVVNTTLEASTLKVASFTEHTDTLLEAVWGPWID